MLSNFLITLISLLGFVTEYNLHCSNGGNCLTILPEKPDTSHVMKNLEGDAMPGLLLGLC